MHRHCRFSMPPAAVLLFVAVSLGGCAEMRDNLTAADSRLQSWFGTATDAPASGVETAAVPRPLSRPDVLAVAERDWNAGRFAHAMKTLRPLAENGNPQAQYRVGLAHAHGRGAPRNAVTALGWWHKAGIQGHAEAQHQLGLAYLAGEGVEVDPGLAAAWLARASAGGHAASTFRLALLHDAEALVADDPARRRAAIVLLERAAEQGHAEAQERMGIAYADGDGVAADAAWSALWLGKAARQGMTAAQARLGDAYAKGAGVPRDPVMAWAWYDIAARAGDEQGRAAQARDALGEDLDAAQRAEGSRLAQTLTKPAGGGGDEDFPTVLFVQQELSRNGLPVGPLDGLIGPRTRSALRSWQAANGLGADGRIGPQTLAALRN